MAAINPQVPSGRITSSSSKSNSPDGHIYQTLQSPTIFTSTRSQLTPRISGRLRSTGTGSSLISSKSNGEDSDPSQGTSCTPLRFNHFGHERNKEHRSRSSPAKASTSITKEQPKPAESTVSITPHPKYHFGCLLRNSLPPMPPGLTAKVNMSASRGPIALHIHSSSSTAATAGNVKVILCVRMPNSSSDVTKISSTGEHGKSTGAFNSMTPCVSIDQRRKQVTLIHPAPSRRRFSLTAPKMFAFDAVLTQEDALAEVCSAALSDAVYSVVHGTDSCVLSYGHAKTGKTRTMLGADTSTASAGVIPCAIAWLFRLIEEQKVCTNTRFSVRVSAVEVFGSDEAFKDLLLGAALESGEELSGPTPSSYLRDGSLPDTKIPVPPNAIPITPAARLSQAMDQLTELRAPTADRAAYFLDIALGNRASATTISHTLFTLHVYQYNVEKNGTESEVSGGRSRLQLLHLGCGRYSGKETPMEFLTVPSSEQKSLSISGMANVLLGLLTGQRHLPHRESAVTQLLREAMTGNHAQPCIIAHVSAQQQHYSETLHVIQLVSRLHRLRRRRVGGSSGTTTASSSIGTASDTSSSCVDTVYGMRRLSGSRVRLGRSSFGRYRSDGVSDGGDCTSSSEQSFDTVIYLGASSSSLSTSSSDHFHLHRPQGPRGSADGSDWQRKLLNCSADEFDESRFTGSGEEEVGMDGSRTLDAKGRFGNSRCISYSEGSGTLQRCLSTGLIKRVTPRTNATAWPRAAAVRKGKELVISNEETWVDGPNAVQEHSSTPASQSVNATYEIPPAPPYHNFHSIVVQSTSVVMETPVVIEEPEPNSLALSQNTIQPIVMENVATLITEAHIKEPTYVSIDLEDEENESTKQQNGDSSSSNSSGSSSGSSSNCSSLDNRNGTGRRGRGYGVLSDISERTEENETTTTAPSSIVEGQAEDERNNSITMLLDLAIQQSGLGNDDIDFCEGGKLNWPLMSSTNKFFDSSQLTFVQSNDANKPLQAENPVNEDTFVAEENEENEPKTPIPQVEKSLDLEPQKTPNMHDMSTSTEGPIDAPNTLTKLPFVRQSVLSNRKTSEPKESPLHRVNNRQSPKRKPSSSTSTTPPSIPGSSFDRVAAWVKDVSSDLAVGSESIESSTTTRVQKHRTHSGEQRHKSHRKGHHKHRSHRSQSNSSSSVCAKCQLCEFEACDLCNQTAVNKELISRSSKHRRSSRSSEYRKEKRGNETSQSSSIEELQQAKPLPSPALSTQIKHHYQHPNLQRHPSDVAKSSTPPTIPVIQRTMSYPWISNSQRLPSITSTSISSPFQRPDTQVVNSGILNIWQHQLIYPSQLPSYRPPICQNPGWSLPTSPYLHSSMQTWSAQINIASSSATDIPLRSYSAGVTPARRQTLQPSTPQNYCRESGESLEKKKSSNSFRFFTLPIFCSLRRWQKQKKEKRENKKREESLTPNPTPTSSSVPVQAAHVDCERDGYNRFGFPINNNPYPNQQYVAFPPPPLPPPTAMVTAQDQVRFGATKEASPAGSSLQSSGDNLSFVNRMHMNLSTYRTSNRSPFKDCNNSRSLTSGDRGSSGYESFRQGGSEVSSSHTDSVDSCCSGCKQAASQRFHPTSRPQQQVLQGHPPRQSCDYSSWQGQQCNNPIHMPVSRSASKSLQAAQLK